MDAYSSYCYKVMLFRLKNAEATYQRLVNKIFKEQISKTMVVYVDNMLVKAPQRADHIKNLAEAFSLLRKYNMKLNPSKCSFGISSGRFLGYLVTLRGIEAQSNQIKVIINVKPPATTKEIQSLTGRAVALNPFPLRSTNKCRAFFKVLKKGQKDKRDEECEVAFENLKTYLPSPPLLSKPIPCKDLVIYLAVSNSTVSSAVIREELEAQHPLFYISKALLDGPRAKNTHVDALANLKLALDTQFRCSIPVEYLNRPSIEEIEQINSTQINEDPSWQDPIIDYLANRNLSKDNLKLGRSSRRPQGNKLIPISYFNPRLTCIKYPQTLDVICKIHDGECGDHSGGRLLAHKTLNVGYFWRS
ncbi:unnamed protein product [Prunus armeniaca]